MKEALIIWLELLDYIWLFFQFMPEFYESENPIPLNTVFYCLLVVVMFTGNYIVYW